MFARRFLFSEKEFVGSFFGSAIIFSYVSFNTTVVKSSKVIYISAIRSETSGKVCIFKSTFTLI